MGGGASKSGAKVAPQRQQSISKNMLPKQLSAKNLFCTPLDLKLRALSLIPRGDELTEADIKALYEAMDIRTFQNGELLVRQGEPMMKFGVLVKGRINVTTDHGVGEFTLSSRDPGYCYGEQSLVNPCVMSTVTLVATDVCEVAYIDRLSLDSVGREFPDISNVLLWLAKERIHMDLPKLPFFDYLIKHMRAKEYTVLGHLDVLSSLVDIVSVPGKTKIFCQGDDGDTMYIVSEGCVRISALSDSEKEVELAMLVNGDVFGEISVIANTKRTATAEAFTPTVVWSISRETMQQFFQICPTCQDYFNETVRSRTASSIKTFEFFDEGLSKDQRIILANQIDFAVFEEGDIIQKANWPFRALLILFRGTVEILKDDVVVTEMDVPGQMFGLNSIVTGVASPVEIRAKSHVQLLVLSQARLVNFLLQVPEFMNKLMDYAHKSRDRFVALGIELPEIGKTEYLHTQVTKYLQRRLGLGVSSPQLLHAEGQEPASCARK